MTALVIYEADHEERAKVLATTYATTAQGVTDKPSKMQGLDTLVFWGHGTRDKLCNLTPVAFLDLVSSWKKLNSELRAVEILTCNARHKQGTHSDSYTEQVVTKLAIKHADIRLRALPVATTKDGEECEWSILKWHTVTATWAYVAAPGADDVKMFAASSILEDFLAPKGEHVGYVRALAAMHAFAGGMTMNSWLPVKYQKQWNQKRVDEWNAKWARVKKESFIMAGALGTLRWCLTDIK